jgi:hypothetical protein
MTPFFSSPGPLDEVHHPFTTLYLDYLPHVLVGHCRDRALLFDRRKIGGRGKESGGERRRYA